MGIEESCAKEFSVVAMDFHNIAGVRIAGNGLDLVAENPLVSGAKAVFLVFSDDDVLLHTKKIERIGVRSNGSAFRTRSNVYPFPCNTHKGLIYCLHFRIPTDDMFLRRIP
jgi:hypothetical protein